MPDNQESKCPTCGGEMVAKDGRSFCPACLLQQGMQPSTFAGNAVFQNWSPPAIEFLVDRFPQLHIESLLGQGGMGAVYRVRQKELDRPAALKVLPDVAAHDPGFTERFLREARLLASLSHPHIVTVYEFGQREGVYFLLMEYIDGVTLRQASLADPIKRLSSKEALAVVGQLCDALQFAHDEGVVHRDIKPENILIDRRGRVKIADFGLAKLLGKPADLPTLTKTHQLMGTPAYMAPEQIEGQPQIDHRVDIYSLGVVFYELLTGELPLGRFQPPSQKADLDARLDEVVLRTLEKEPDRRYQQASQVRTDMDAIRSPGVSAASRRKHWTVVRPLLYVLAGVVLTLVSTRFPFMPGGILRIDVPDRNETHAEKDYTPVPVAGESDYEASDGDFEMSYDNESGMMGSGDGGADMSMEGMSDFGSGGEDMLGAGLGEMMDMGMGSGAVQEQRPILEFSEDTVTLRADIGKLTADKRDKVNQILSDLHQQYIQLEADHSLISVRDDGSVETTVYCFPLKWQRLEDELWTQLDDCLNVDQQRELRQWLPVTGTHLSGYMGMSMGDGGGGFSGGAFGLGDDYEGEMGGISSAASAPGLLGWAQPAATEGVHDRILRTVRIIRKGRWFQCGIGNGKRTTVSPSAPSIPSELARFDHEPGPLTAFANANAAFQLEKWDALLDCFTTRCLIRWAAESNARIQIAALTDPNLGDRRSPTDLDVLIVNKTLLAMPPAYHEHSERSSGDAGSQRRHQLVNDFSKEPDTARQEEILDELESLESHERMMFLFETFSIFSILDAIEFPLRDVDVSTILETQSIASAELKHPTGDDSFARVVLIDNQWRIDQMDIHWKSIGLPEDVTAGSVTPGFQAEPVEESSADIPESLDQP